MRAAKAALPFRYLVHHAFPDIRRTAPISGSCHGTQCCASFAAGTPCYLGAAGDYRTVRPAHPLASMLLCLTDMNMNNVFVWFLIAAPSFPHRYPIKWVSLLLVPSASGILLTRAVHPLLLALVGLALANHMLLGSLVPFWLSTPPPHRDTSSCGR